MTWSKTNKLNGQSGLVENEFRLKRHLRPFFGDIRAASFSTSDLKRYVNMRLEAGAANATVKWELEIVKEAFSLVATSDPPKAAREPHIKMLEEKNVRTGFLDDAGYIRLKHEVPEYLRPLFVVGYHTGTRLRELRNCNGSRLTSHTTRSYSIPAKRRVKAAHCRSTGRCGNG